jgi:hypothetical protein
MLQLQVCTLYIQCVHPTMTLVVTGAETPAAPRVTGIEASKQLAAWTAVDHHVRKEHKVCIFSFEFVPV